MAKTIERADGLIVDVGVNARIERVTTPELARDDKGEPKRDRRGQAIALRDGKGEVVFKWKVFSRHSNDLHPDGESQEIAGALYAHPAIKDKTHPDRPAHTIHDYTWIVAGEAFSKAEALAKAQGFASDTAVHKPKGPLHASFKPAAKA